MVYAALIPIIGGVGLASLKELSFTWTALIAASLANQAAALKNVVSKVSNSLLLHHTKQIFQNNFPQKQFVFETSIFLVINFVINLIFLIHRVLWASHGLKLLVLRILTPLLPSLLFYSPCKRQLLSNLVLALHLSP
jgi:hypothetical protein